MGVWSLVGTESDFVVCWACGYVSTYKLDIGREENKGGAKRRNDTRNKENKRDDSRRRDEKNINEGGGILRKEKRGVKGATNHLSLNLSGHNPGTASNLPYSAANSNH